MSALTDIQSKLKRPIMVPFREFTADEWKTIGRLRQIVRRGLMTGIWTEITMELRPDGARLVLDGVSGGKTATLTLGGEETEEIFGVDLPLGPVLTKLKEVTLANEPDVRQAVNNSQNEDAPIKIKLIPGADDTVMAEYVEWQVAQNSLD